jgi:DNA-binding Xre family transcriptional regulator
MFLTERQIEERLKSDRNLANADWLKKDAPVTTTEKVISLPGRNRIAISKEERTEIAIESRLGIHTQTELARAHGISQYAVHAIEKGKTKGIDEVQVEKVIGDVKDRALSRLMSSLGLLTDDKLSGCSAKDLSVIASNMGRVVEKISPKETQPDNINFIIYSPELKQERAFEVVEI